MGMFSSLMGGGGSAKRAAQVSAESQQRAADLVRRRAAKYQEQYYQPYVEAGQAAIPKYQEAISTLPQYAEDINQYRGALAPIVNQITSKDLSQFQTSPGYEFRRAEGMKALESSQAARGGLLSGEALKAAEQYGQNVATSEYDNYLTRLYNQLNAVGTQISGAQAGQSAAMNAANAWNPLMNYGYNAGDAAARLGMGAAGQEAGYVTGAGATSASGIQAKATQMASAGDQWINLAATAAGAALGGAPGAMMASKLAPKFATGNGQQQFSQGGTPYDYYGQSSYGMLAPQNATTSTAQSTPWVNPDYLSLPAQDTTLPWYNQQQQQSRQLKTQSVYS